MQESQDPMDVESFLRVLGHDYHQVRDEMTRLEDFIMQMSFNPDEWVSFGQTWHLYADGNGWYRWICATDTLTHCREELLKDMWAKEHCQIIATSLGPTRNRPS